METCTIRASLICGVLLAWGARNFGFLAGCVAISEVCFASARWPGRGGQRLTKRRRRNPETVAVLGDGATCYVVAAPLQRRSQLGI